MSRLNDAVCAAASVALLFVCGSAAAAEPAAPRRLLQIYGPDHRFERSTLSTLTYSGGRITIEHSLGNVRIRTGDDSNVTVKALIRASDEQTGNAIRVITSGGSHGISVRTEYPEGDDDLGRIQSYSVDYDITVPERAPLTVRDKFGNIDVEGIRAPGDFTNSMGAIRLTNASGTQTLETSFGSINVTSVSGGVKVRGTSGSVTVASGGNVEVTNRFGSVNVRESGPVTISSTSGSVVVRNSAGVAVTSDFGTADIGTVRGDVLVSGTNGNIAVRDVSGRTTVRGGFGAIEVSNAGDVSVASHNGRVRVAHTRGAVHVSSNMDQIEIREAGGGARVTSSSGEIIAIDTNGNLSIDTSRVAIPVLNHRPPRKPAKAAAEH
jgi:hypothetical protein